MCPICATQITPEWFFCPNCGKELREKPFSVSIGKQIGMYLVSFFLAPIGLHWAVRYLRYKDIKAKRLGLFIIVLTGMSVSITLFTFKKVADTYSKTLQNLNKINNINDVNKLF